MDQQLREASLGIAGAMQAMAFEAGGPTRLYESDLRSATRRMLQVHLPRQVRAEHSIGLPGWKRVGPVDVVVSGARANSPLDAAIELKWNGKAAECLWDAWKLAALYRAGGAYTTYLLAGGPPSFWSADRQPLAAIWVPGIHRSADLWRIAGKARWKPGVTGPAQVPPGIRVRAVAQFPLHTAAPVDWEIRAVKITTTPGADLSLVGR